MGWNKPGILKLLPSPTVVPRQRISETLGMIPRGARVLDVGAGGRRITPEIVAFDAVFANGVDIVGDIHRMPIAKDSFDCIFCTGTLEHVGDPWQAIKEMRRILRPGGVIHIDVPFMQGYHADPTDYWRFTLDGLKLLCREFEEIDSGVHIGPSSAVTWVVREWSNLLLDNKYLSNLLYIITAIVMYPVKYIDFLIIRKPRSHRLASAVYFRGRKPEG